MSNIATLPRTALFRVKRGELWSGDLGLTLISISLCVLVFVITPMREAGVPAGSRRPPHHGAYGVRRHCG